ncbi:class I SAM-dependent methyltransferase [Nocardia otitidiscaviarum]|uniref:class I SAM-dependent methyltransferase n=1 Tax=Nocardia otitidiscaviarum TaxID=1823 RepID=UPI0018939375|nr:class I SAM-dependent methyltransferase [Nocardia otitidiscaviarum]MBF6180054.1 methyltransferase domain-containing protein [Nocardia otitidiscaviarum]
MADFDWNAVYRGDGSDTMPPDTPLLAHTATLTPGTALDLGCGAGGNALELVRRGWRVTGVDIAPRALASARASACARGLELELVLGDSVTWRPEIRYDLVLSSYALPVGAAAQAATYATIAAALAPGGTLVLAEWDGERTTWAGPGELVTAAALDEGIVAAGLRVERLERVLVPAHRHRGDESPVPREAALVLVARAAHDILGSGH